MAYKANSNLKDLEKRYDLLYILLLDSSHRNKIIKYDSELEQYFNEYSSAMNVNDATVGFITHFTEIMQVFDAEFRIFNCLIDLSTVSNRKYTINYPIYINKNNNTAIAEISSPSSCDVFYFRLHEGIVQINWLGGVIE